MTKLAPRWDEQSFTERYEQLRAGMIGGTFAANGRGLSVLLRRGLTAWMWFIDGCAPAPPIATQHCATANEPPTAKECDARLVQALADMALGSYAGEKRQAGAIMP